MDVSTVLRACVRCWYVVLVVLGVTGFLAAGYYRDSQPQYSVSAQVLVVPSASLLAIRSPDSGTGGASTNPFNATSGGSTLANALSSSLNTALVQSSILPSGVGLTAAWNTEANSVVSLTTVASSATEAQDGMADVVMQLNSVLAGIQTRAGAGIDQLYVASLISEPDFPLQTFPDRLRLVVGSVLAGLVVAVVLAVLLDSVLAGRRERRHLAAPTGDAGGQSRRRRWRPHTSEGFALTASADYPAVPAQDDGGINVDHLRDGSGEVREQHER